LDIRVTDHEMLYEFFHQLYICFPNLNTLIIESEHEYTEINFQQLFKFQLLSSCTLHISKCHNINWQNVSPLLWLDTLAICDTNNQLKLPTNEIVPNLQHFKLTDTSIYTDRDTISSTSTLAAKQIRKKKYKHIMRYGHTLYMLGNNKHFRSLISCSFCDDHEMLFK
jgi:hypothetical protein